MEFFDGPIDQPPMAFVPGDEQRRMLTDVLSGLELGAWDERILTWLASWDTCTTVTIASWLRRVRGVDAGP